MMKPSANKSLMMVANYIGDNTIKKTLNIK